MVARLGALRRLSSAPSPRRSASIILRMQRPLFRHRLDRRRRGGAARHHRRGAAHRRRRRPQRAAPGRRARRCRPRSFSARMIADHDRRLCSSRSWSTAAGSASGCAASSRTRTPPTWSASIPRVYKIIAYTLSALFCGTVGAAYASWTGYIDPTDSFSILMTHQGAGHVPARRPGHGVRSGRRRRRVHRCWKRSSGPISSTTTAPFSAPSSSS